MMAVFRATIFVTVDFVGLLSTACVTLADRVVACETDTPCETRYLVWQYNYEYDSSHVQSTRQPQAAVPIHILYCTASIRSGEGDRPELRRVARASGRISSMCRPRRRFCVQ
jgi:hypothetical protein